jgi:hypothetical protein
MAFHDDRSSGKPSKSTVDAHKAALEALFAPREPTPTPAPVAKRDSAKLVVARKKDDDPRDPERAKLLQKLLGAEGRAAISRHADELRRKGFVLPEQQEVFLQLLEHADEALVRDALLALSRILEREAPKRRAVLDSRLRRLEEGAEDPATRALAERLRQKVAKAPR